MARLERWITRTIADRNDPDEQQLLHRYAVWHLLRRLRRRCGDAATTHSQAVVVQQHVRAAITLLDWLTAHDLTPGHRRAGRPRDLAGQRRGHPPPRGRELRALGQAAEADPPGLRRHQMGRPDPGHRHRDPLGTGPLAAPRRHPQTRGPRRRAARPALRPMARDDQPPHPRPRRTSDDTRYGSGSAANRSCCPNPSPTSSGRSPRPAAATPPSATRHLPLAVPRRPTRPPDQRLPARPNDSASSASTPDNPAPPRCSNSPPNSPPRSSPACSASTSASPSPGNAPAAGDWTTYAADVSRRPRP